jgi:hypothetical protein
MPQETAAHPRKGWDYALAALIVNLSERLMQRLHLTTRRRIGLAFYGSWFVPPIITAVAVPHISINPGTFFFIVLFAGSAFFLSVIPSFCFDYVYQRRDALFDPDRKFKSQLTPHR